MTHLTERNANETYEDHTHECQICHRRFACLGECLGMLDCGRCEEAE